MKWIATLTFAFFTSIAFAGCRPCYAGNVNIGREVVKNAKKYVGTVETPRNSNRGPEIDAFHRYFGLPYGNPYCLMFTLYNYHEVFDRYGISNPLPKIARVSAFFKWAESHNMTVKTVRTKALVWGAQDIPEGAIVLWASGNNVSLVSNFNGHAGVNKKVVKPQDVFTVEGNTNAGSGGDQREGGGIWERERHFAINSNFPIIAFVYLRKNEYEVK